jgi:hypothetical protein
MLSHIHQRGMADLRAHLGSQASGTRGQPTSWLAQQRKQVGQICVCETYAIAHTLCSRGRHCSAHELRDVRRVYPCIVDWF